MFQVVTNRQARKGISLVELAVVIVIIGVLAAFGVPRFIKSAERSKAAEAFSFLAAVRSAQERYHAREGTYASTMDQIDIKMAAPKYFTVGTFQAATATASAGDGTLQTSWEVTLTRTGAAAGYGAYTVIFNEDGFDPASTINGFPDINPMGPDPSGGSTTTSS